MKPALTWTIALGGLLLLAGAMAWATHSLIGMERTQHRMAAEAAVQERSRLALWRMESIAAALVVEESARSPDQYHAAPALAPPVSPDSRIRLHFELDADGRVRSPQAAEGPEKPVIPDQAALRLQELRARLAEKADPSQWVLLGKVSRRDVPADNRAWLSAANGAPPPGGVEDTENSRLLSAGAAVISQDPATVPPPVPVLEYAAPQLPSALKPAEAREEQDSNNKKEAAMRQQTIVNLNKAATSPRRQVEDLLKDQRVAPPAAVALKTRSGVAEQASPAATQGDAGGPAPAAAEAEAAPAPAAGMFADEATSSAAVPPARPQPPAISDFRAFWIKDALLLTRRVTSDGASVIQGAWVDWPQLRTDLLAAVSDLFPAAALEAASADRAGGTDLLASLPIRLRPGLLTIPAPPFWSPLKLSLATAWVCVLLASATVAMVLRGMMLLSERRAAFVSAVTHELRTPLATFKLYSEMLADGLVKDPARRQSYLETLTTEADRLGHLVENVLSYSRLERGKASNGQIPTTLQDLLSRVEPRLHQRVATAGAEFSIHHSAVPGDFELITDPAAVEQIVFNLVDNACKYAGQPGIPAQVELAIKRGPAVLELAVRDHGPGLTKTEARKLFRPFHKSAREAAHSAPGVGLGLALCRRLARDLGGALDIDHTWPHGACFVLTLPVLAEKS